MAKRSKQALPAANLDDFIVAPKDDMKKGVESLLRSDAETARDNSEGQVSIVGIHTVGPAGPQTVFRMHEDPLLLKIDIQANANPACAETLFNANFQILEYATNTVARNSWWPSLTLRYGTAFCISQGNNQGLPEDFTSPAAWGLKPGLYVFRALIELPALNVFSQPDHSVLFKVVL
jgi:hypothetical protein